MRIRNNWFFMIFKIALVIFAGWGLLLHMGPGKWSSFNYYTVLSNLVCFLYFMAAVIYNIRLLTRGGRETQTLRPRLEGAVVFCITVTFLIYHFILRPEAFRMGNDSGFWSASNMICHYVVPVMTILDWILLCPKGIWRKSDPLKWMLIPVTYFVYIVLRAPIAGNIGNTASPYPYGFIDAQAHGWGAVLTNIAWIAPAMIALAYIIYLLDRGMAGLCKGGKA